MIGKYFKKGCSILVEGRLKYDSWDDKQTNQKRSRLVVVLENFQFLDSGRSEGGASGSAPARPATPTPPPEPSEPDGPPVEQDDVPF